MKNLDTKGYTCPTPLIMLKEALLELNDGEKLKVETDNETSLKNLLSYLKDQGVEPEVSSEGKVHTIITAKPPKAFESSDPAAYCSTGNEDYVVSLTSELMGAGDDKLGKLLMETFLDHLKLQDKLPTHVVLYNAGVKLARKQTSTCSALAELEDMGIRIMVCGTCIDHFGIQAEMGVGMISNMVVITETLANTGHVVNP